MTFSIGNKCQISFPESEHIGYTNWPSGTLVEICGFLTSGNENYIRVIGLEGYYQGAVQSIKPHHLVPAKKPPSGFSKFQEKIKTESY